MKTSIQWAKIFFKKGWGKSGVFCQDGNSSSLTIAEVKHLVLDHFSVGSKLSGSAAVEQSKCKYNLIAQGDGILGPCG